MAISMDIDDTSTPEEKTMPPVRSSNEVVLTGRLDRDAEIKKTQSGSEKAAMRIKVTEPGFSYVKDGQEVTVPQKDHWYSATAVGKAVDDARELKKDDLVTVRGKCDTYLHSLTKRPVIGVTAFEVRQPAAEDLREPNVVTVRGRITQVNVRVNNREPGLSSVDYTVTPFTRAGARETSLSIREFSADAAALAEQRAINKEVELRGKLTITAFVSARSNERVEIHSISTTPAHVTMLTAEATAAAADAREQSEVVPSEAAPAGVAPGADSPTPTKTVAEIIQEGSYHEVDGSFIGVRSLASRNGVEPFAVVKDEAGKAFLYRDTELFAGVQPGEHVRATMTPDGLSVSGEAALAEQPENTLVVDAAELE
uniref:Single-stranded DNA-binding protein n=1 Tax=mine drainage metagenome TaxID=410659 RepID=E6QPC2_9ZZZZ